MGQRFQSVFILPSIYMNEGNPNNRSEHVLVFHNQWLYGFKAVQLHLNIMQKLKQAIKERRKSGAFGQDKKGFINFHLERYLINIINLVGLEDIHNTREWHKIGDYDFIGFEDLGKQLLRCDNNNGFFICKIDNNLKMSYSFISGLEDTPTHQVKNPIYYFKLFYTEKQFKDLSKKDKKVFDDYLKFDGMLLKDVKEIITQLNKPILEKPI